jgi:mannan endo-1,4-beta-mannosidase
MHFIKKSFCNAGIPVMVLLVLFTSLACKTPDKEKNLITELADKEASKNVIHLYKELKVLSKKGFAIGHQETTSYGVGWNYEDDRSIIKSDVKEISGNFPAVFGFEIGHLELGHKRNLDSVSFDIMRELIIDAYRKGGIITISWHADNPISGGSTWDKTPAVKHIITGGKYHDTFEIWIQRLALFFDSLKIDNEHIPIIFRPYHEMNGSWFWWGEGNCTSDEYKRIWRETVHLLRDKHHVHNLLYVYSPNKLNPDDDYLKYYPGNDYVDILGIDIYDFNNSEDYIKSVVNDLSLVRKIAVEMKKPYAFTETGLERIPTQNWYTEVLYPNIKDSGIAWVLFWRNAHKEHHYIPYKGHPAEKDFLKFEKLPETLFLQDLNQLNN